MFIESAYFDPARIAQTGRKLGIVSDARYRFERGVDPEFVVPGLELATKLILEFCGGEPSEIVVAGDVPEWKRTIVFSPGAVKRLAGIDVPKPEIVRILTKLGFAVTGDEPLSVQPPSWRGDVEGAADLVEEVVRIHGLENVPSAADVAPNAMARPTLTPAQRRTRLVRRVIAARGFNETINFSFIPRAHAAAVRRRRRRAPAGKSHRGRSRRAAAERVAVAAGGGAAQSGARVQRSDAVRNRRAVRQRHAGGADRPSPPAFASASRNAAGRNPRHAPDAFDAKADMLAAIETAMGGPMTAPVKAGRRSAGITPAAPARWRSGRRCSRISASCIRRSLAAFDLKGPAAAFEMFLDAIPEPKSQEQGARAVRAVAVPAGGARFRFRAGCERLRRRGDQGGEIRRARRSIERVDVFDLYEGKGIPEGKKSLAIAVRLQPKDKTLTERRSRPSRKRSSAAVTKATGGHGLRV